VVPQHIAASRPSRSLTRLNATEPEAAEPVTPAVAVAEPPATVTPLQDLKAALLDTLFGTDRGLSARSEVRAEINELISQLEAQNPTPSPAEAQNLLNGSWKLVYTSNSELLAVLALSKLPFVSIGDVTQTIDAAAATVENKVQLTVPLSRTAFSTTASFEVRSPKRLQLKVEKGTVSTPQLLSEIELPNNLSVLGQAIDLTQLKSALDPINERLKGVLTQVGNLISQQPDLNFAVPSNDKIETWLLTTYLDNDTRITRGDGGSVFVLVKELSIATPVTVAEPSPAPPAPVTTIPKDE